MPNLTLENLEFFILSFGREFDRTIRPAIRQGANVIRRRARTKNYGFTDRSGALRRSINIDTRNDMVRLRAGGRGARHAHFIEFNYNRRYSFLYRALDETNEQEILDAILAKLREDFPRELRRIERALPRLRR